MSSAQLLYFLGKAFDLPFQALYPLFNVICAQLRRGRAPARFSIERIEFDTRRRAGLLRANGHGPWPAMPPACASFVSAPGIGNAA
jgi:hypothetical protein